MSDAEKAPPSDQPDLSGKPELSEADIAKAEREQLARLAAELAQANEQHLRARAELANFQKRVERDRGLTAQAIKRDFVKALLPALDALDLALKHAAADAKALLEGVAAARDAVEKALADQGAERIGSSGTWDPDLHHPQAIVERADLPDGTILEELRPGYKVGNLVARHGEVVVSRRPAQKPKAGPQQTPSAKPPESPEEQ